MNAEQPPSSPTGPRGVGGWVALGAIALVGLMLAGPIYWDVRAAVIRSRGARATARIVEARPTGSRFNRDPVVEYHLELERDGHPPGPRGRVTDALSPALQPRYQPGLRVPVYFDPADPSAMAFESE